MQNLEAGTTLVSVLTAAVLVTLLAFLTIGSVVAGVFGNGCW